MAFLLNKTTILSRFQSSSSKTEDRFLRSYRRHHIEPGAREKALLEEDPALTRFRPDKKRIKQLIRLGNIFNAVVIAGCCYMVFVNAIMPKEAQKQVQTTREGHHEAGALLQENRT